MKNILIISASPRKGGTGAYEKGAVRDMPVFQEAYEAGKNC